MLQAPQPQPEFPVNVPAENLQKTNEIEKTNPVKPQPIAAAFKPLAKLETYIGSQTRSGDFRFRVSEPQSGAVLPIRAGQTTFRFYGKVEGKTPAGATFNLKIFNNNPQRFEAMQPVDDRALELKPNGEFLLQKNLKLAPGLYYLLVEDQQSGEWAFVDRFLVK